jgi:probable HAF family extracellular repeat protein
MLAGLSLFSFGLPARSQNTSAFLYEDGTFTPIGPSGAAQAYGINDAGEIVGLIESGGTYYGFSLVNGVYQKLNPPGAQWSGATAVNNEGQIVGYAYNGVDEYGFLYINGVYTILATNYQPFGINNSGVISGTVLGIAGFIYTNGAYDIVNDAEQLYGINDNDLVVGINSQGEQNEGNGFVYNYVTNQAQLTFSRYVQPLDINDLGQFVGLITTNDLTGGFRGFMYDNGTFTAINDPNATPAYGTIAWGINDYGAVVGYYFLPEPSTWAMMLTGFAALAYAGYWRTRTPVAVKV